MGKDSLASLTRDIAFDEHELDASDARSGAFRLRSRVGYLEILTALVLSRAFLPSPTPPGLRDRDLCWYFSRESAALRIDALGRPFLESFRFSETLSGGKCVGFEARCFEDRSLRRIGVHRSERLGPRR